MDILNIFYSHPFWAWLSVATILLVAELLTGTTFMLWFSLAAGVNAILLSMLPRFGLEFDLISFSVLAFVITFMGAKVFPFTGKVEKNDINDPNSRLVGTKVIAMEDFQSGLGAVKVGDTRWRALSAHGNPKIGDEVIITKIDGATLFVEHIQ